MQVASVSLDRQFEIHFKKLSQVFLCVTNECNLRCVHCLYKPWLRKGEEIPIDVACGLLRAFRNLGARKLSILGGEPTLYGCVVSQDVLGILISYARSIGYDYIRLVTNGQFRQSFNLKALRDSVNEVTFSFDGYSADVHDRIRGKNTFARSVGNFERALAEGIVLDITFTVNRFSIAAADTPSDSVDEAIRWAASIGAKRINFHPILEMGIARDSWVSRTYVTQKEWEVVYGDIHKRVQEGRYPISVRLPRRFISQSEFESSPRYYGFCPVLLGERVEVHPNGQIQVCALHKGTDVSIARFHQRSGEVRIEWEGDSSNELVRVGAGDINRKGCSVITLCESHSVPLCISHKAGQDEFAWNELWVGSEEL